MAARTFLFTFLISQVSCGENSLTFVIDKSASMYDEIYEVKDAAKSIVDIVLNEKASQIEDILLVTFRNHVDRTLENVKLETKTRDAQQLKLALDRIKTKTAFCNEVTLSGIKKGLEESRQGSYMFVFTDTTAYDFDKFPEIKTLCQEKQIQIVIVLTGIDCGHESQEAYKVYFKIAKACDGQVFRINKSEFPQVLDYVRDTIKGENAVIETKTIPPSNNSEYINFNVDKQTESVTVSASGSSVELKILHGTTEEIRGTRLMWTKNVKIIKLTNLQPGSYTAMVKGHSEVTIKIEARTDFQFQHGFSTTVQTNLKVTDVQPTTAVETLLMVSVQDKHHSANIRRVELLDMQGVVVRRLDLTQVQPDIYKTDMFLSPEQTFKISVVAESISTGRMVRRYAKTPVTPIQSVPPAIFKSGNILKVKEDSSVDINCRIIGGKPRPQISWYLKKQGATKFTPLSSTDEVYHVAKALTNDQYKCVARNVRDQDMHSVTLDVQMRPRFQNTAKTIMTKEGEQFTIDCRLLKGNPQPKITWYFKPRGTSDFMMKSHEGEVWSVSSASHLTHSGEYKCIANNNEGSDEKFTKVVIKAKPTIENPETKQSAMENTTTILHCRVRGFPEPTVSWFYKGPRSTEFKMISGNSESLHLNHIQLGEAGQYKCVAENEMGTTDHVVALTVNAPPRIVFIPPNSSDYFGVEGDVAMRLQCNAVGYPIPTITWKVDNHIVGKDQSKELYVKNNDLFLLNPKEAHSSDNSHSYVCLATNNFRVTTQAYQVHISKYADSSNVSGTNYGAVELPYNFTCPLPFTDPNSVRWYKNYTYLVTGPSLHFAHPVEGDSGNYTCRVSDMNSASSYTVEVIFGRAPKRDEISYKIRWSGEEWTKIACYSDESPLGEYSWSYNGKVMEGVHTQSLLPIGWGQYTCQISHPLGNLVLNFQITTKNKECGIPTSFLKTEHAPLILDSSLEWPTFSITGHYLIVPHSEKLQLICQDEKSSTTNSFTKFPREKSIYATCDKEDSFLVDSVPQKILELNCKNSVTSNTVKSGEQCLGENTELVQVGFHVNGFKKVYQSCVDNIKHVPLYTKMDTIALNKVSSERVGGRSMKSACIDKCCYEKIQLVNAEDVGFGPAEKTTFIDTLNSVNYCKNNNGTNWDDIEKVARERAEREQFTVWSGAVNYTKAGGFWTPKYLWKVMKPHDGSEKMVVIQENTKEVGHKLCHGLCGGEVIWFEPAGDRTYCCSLDDFKKAFGVALDFD